MVKIQIDGSSFEVSQDKNLLETCLGLGFDVPYFCNHPALGSVGACRLCAVKKYANADDKKGRIVMSCMEPVIDGMIISVNDPEAKAFRASILEGLMANHPHDCPICDEGGECHLQDMTVMTGHNYRRYDFKKRTYNNQNLGPFINHEMNRCIQCYRCVRFYRDYAGGKDLNVFGSANHVYFGRQKDGTLESEFSGNLAEVCPTGVFTDKTLKKHFARKWDMTNSPSICTNCSIGCNTILGERYGTVRRVMSRYNSSINGYFLCDRGRFGYEFLNDPKRIKTIQYRISKKSDLKVDGDSNYLSEIIPTELNSKVIGIGSPRASLESNYALLNYVGKSNFFHGISGKDYNLTKKAVQILNSRIAHLPSLKEVEKCDAIFILGEDVTNTAPMLALALRQAIRNKSIGIAAKLGIPKWNDAAVREMDQNIKSPLFIASPFSTKLDDIAEETFYSAPENIARLGFLVASLICSSSPAVTDADSLLLDLATKIAKALLAAQNPLIVAGVTGNQDILNASSNILNALNENGKKGSISIAFAESNSVGLAMLDGNSLDDAIEVINKEQVEKLVILENDLYIRECKDKVDSIIEKCQQVIVLDYLQNQTTLKADILLPTATYAESAGTIVNNEGRAQRYYNVLPLTETIKESWHWIADLKELSSKSNEGQWKHFDNVVNSLVRDYPVFSGIKDQMPNADFKFFNEKIARQTMRFSGRTTMNANVSVSEPKPPQDNDSPLNFSMEGFKGVTPSSLTPYYWSPGWNSSQAMNKYMNEPNRELKGGDTGVKLFGDLNNSGLPYFKVIPKAFKPRNDEFLIIPVYQIFGSEELSSRGEAVSERISKPFIAMNGNDIAKLKLNENETYKFNINQVTLSLLVRRENSLSAGVAGLAFIIPEMVYIELPAWGKVVTV